MARFTSPLALLALLPFIHASHGRKIVVPNNANLVSSQPLIDLIPHCLTLARLVPWCGNTRRQCADFDLRVQRP
jgi:hypothetical protein